MVQGNRRPLDGSCLAADVDRAKGQLVPVRRALVIGPDVSRTVDRAAAKAATIDEYRANHISDYDFRHSRLTHLGQVTSNLNGMMYLAGHTQPVTTARYRRPQKAAAEEALQAAAAAGGPELWLHTGYAKGGAKRHSSKSPQKEKPRTAGNGSGFRECEEGESNPHGS